MSIYAPPQVGTAIQVQNSTASAVATGTTILPFDDTIPQNTEGDQYLSIAITPRSTTNVLIVTVIMHCSHSSASSSNSVAIFQDSTANALAANSVFMATATGRTTLVLSTTLTAGTTSSTTFKARAGSNNAGTFTFNGFSGGRVFGGSIQSSITVVEYVG